MKTTCLGVAIAALLSASATAGEYKAVEPHSCYPSVEKWMEHQGRKVEQTNAVFGAFAEHVIRWDSGSRNVVTVGPVNGQICVVASRFLGREEPPVAAIE